MEENIKCAYTDVVDIDTLIPNPKNPNHHPEEQIRLLSKLIKRNGQIHPVIVSKRSGFVIIGHGRLEAIKQLGWKKIAIDKQDFEDEAHEYSAMVSDNKIQEFSDMDNSEVIQEAFELGIDDTELLAIPKMPEVDTSEIDSFFEDVEEKKKEPKKVKCPHCGEEFEL